MSTAVIAPSLPQLRAHFASAEGVDMLARLMLSMPALVIALAAPWTGWLVDRLSRRHLLVAGAVLFGLSGATGLLIDSLTQLLVSRALLGLAVAVLMTTVSALAAGYYEGAALNRFVGLQSAFAGVGGLVFLGSGGALADLHWRAPFALYALAFAMVPAMLAKLPEGPALRPLAAAGTASTGSANPSTTTGTTAAVGTPWLAVATLVGAALLNSTAWFIVPTQLPFRLVEMGIPRASLGGVAIGLGTLVSSFMSLGYRALRGRLSSAAVFALGFGLAACSHTLVAHAQSYAMVLLAMLFTGLSIGLISPNLMGTMMGLAPEHLRGRLAGILTSAIFGGQFLSPLFSQPWVNRYGLVATFADMGRLLAVVALLIGLSIGLSALWQRMRTRECAPPRQDETDI